ncbi:cell surface protein [Levilactobacillus brevis]|uniref:Cell surface protein n=1 Tax=Levilactobacillus brevis TaxID=1580 RepID=A0A0D0GRW4_LEVBR|nr:WxL domain-containing protein [Levilactobacillus brevis]AJA81168.1 hypothetical protein L747_09975 [Levilactobacillus brevis BSO 464]ANN48200.1 cell surface protein [Levilactobacillus brevis]ARN91668.1 cell surface protein [Levilactobacillus brevis]ARN94407.1 cell surface protein [Levilactobacillus brevis]KIO94602.1 extracellular protein [Levilactobacillus brevis]
MTHHAPKRRLTVAISLFIISVLAFPVDAAAAQSTGNVDQETATSATVATAVDAVPTLDAVPNIDFGENSTPNTQSGRYLAATVDQPLQVTNPGLTSGWAVQLKSSGFTDQVGDSLRGAMLLLGTPAIMSPNTGNSSTPPTANQVSVAGSDSDQVIWSAPQNGGLGQWVATYALNTIQLTVPAGQVAGLYTTTLTWQLDDAPQ